MTDVRDGIYGAWSRRQFMERTGAVAASLAAGGALAAVPGPEALSLANGRRQELLDLVVSLVRVRSLSGESAAEAQSLVRQFLSGLPYRVDESADRPSQFADHAEYMQPNPPGDGPFVNLVGWPESAARRRYAMFAHIDSHSIDEGWRTEPLSPVLRDGRLYGLGTSDDKGGVAAMLIAAAVLADLGGPLPVVMSLHGKGGGSRGSLPVFDRLRGTGHGIGAVLYVHPAETGRGLEDIKTAVQGVLDLELSVQGWRAPQMEIGSVDSGSWADSGNALDMCWTLLGHLRDGVFADVAVNLGVMEGGDRLGSAAEQAVARFRLKFSGEHSWKRLLAEGRASLQAFAAELPQSGPGFRFDLKPGAYRTNPGAADWDAPVSQVLRQSITDVTGRAPDAYPNHYAGDIRYPIRLLDVPAYGIGSLGGNFYGPNEWVDIDDLVKLVAVLVQTLSGWSEL